MKISDISPGIQLWGAAMIFLCLWIAVGKKNLKFRTTIALLVGNKEYNEQHIQWSWPQHISHHWLFSVRASKQCQLKKPFSKNSSFTYLSHGINIGLTLFSVRSRESSKLISAKEKLKIPFYLLTLEKETILVTTLNKSQNNYLAINNMINMFHFDEH